MASPNASGIDFIKDCTKDTKHLLSPEPMIIRSNDCSLEEHTVATSFNFDVKVYVQKSENKTPIVTFHDIGTNHNSLLGFFNYREMRVILQNFTVYHICAPGHEDNAATINLNNEDKSAESETLLIEKSEEPSIISIMKNKSIEYLFGQSSSSVHQYPTMDELADVIESVVTHFGIKYFLGFGVGAGSNVLARYALKHQKNVHALFLINPDDSTHSYYQWMKMHYYDVPQMNAGFVNDNMLNQLEWHWFGYNQNHNIDLIEYYEQLMKSLNSRNVAGYIDSYLQRTDLGLVRSLRLEESILLDQNSQQPGKHIDAEVMLVTGSLCQDLARNLAEMNGRMNPDKTQYLIMEDCNGMLMEEHPDKLAVNFLHFLRNVSLLIKWTPEKLLIKAEKLQNKLFDESQAPAALWNDK